MFYSYMLLNINLHDNSDDCTIKHTKVKLVLRPYMYVIDAMLNARPRDNG